MPTTKIDETFSSIIQHEGPIENTICTLTCRCGKCGDITIIPVTEESKSFEGTADHWKERFEKLMTRLKQIRHTVKSLDSVIKKLKKAS